MRMTLKTRVGLILMGCGILYSIGDSQTTCSTPPSNATTSSNGNQYALPANTQVTVYFDGSQFDAADIGAMEQAFQTGRMLTQHQASHSVLQLQAHHLRQGHSLPCQRVAL